MTRRPTRSTLFPSRRSSDLPVSIGQIAKVRIGETIKRGEGSHNARPAVILGVLKQPGANTLDLTRTLDAVLDDLQAALPQGRSEEHTSELQSRRDLVCRLLL